MRKRITNVRIRLRGCAVWSVPLLFACNKVRLSHMEAHMVNFLNIWTTLRQANRYKNSTKHPAACMSESRNIDEGSDQTSLDSLPIGLQLFIGQSNDCVSN